ncbi:hypothetical protein QAD02_012505 [Eretmocerus hayati]|uniref:Uncharacterized protein n=1 Tax=Eretmocerus hayati TaxID=131215 RepID=A0ACC2NZW5_9HYME|nr:hypothetical protein QAD02_012505 [Eretmocerus hayati]
MAFEYWMPQKSVTVMMIRDLAGAILINEISVNTMADYWKSQDRKYCDFCKCWIADNKPSIQFHENGKRHKENVTKRVKEIHKNSVKQAKQQKKFENDIEKMEKAAMAAYLKDVEGNTRDLMADKIIHEKLNKTEEKKVVEETPNYNQTPDAELGAHPRSSGLSLMREFDASDIDPFDPYAKQKLARLEAKNKAKAKKEAKEAAKKEEHAKEEKASRDKIVPTVPIRKVWYEARSQGHSYYWNIDTNETMWEPPFEGFMSLEEQAAEVKEQELQEKLMSEIDKEQEKEQALILEERRANEEREKLKEIRKRFLEKKKADKQNESDDDDDEESKDKKIPYRRDYSVPEKPQPYGSWQVVKTIQTPKIDLQLPRVKTNETFTPTVVHEPPATRTFKEKVVTHISPTSSDDEGPSTSFKKQKFGSFRRKNIRQRTTDD